MYQWEYHAPNWDYERNGTTAVAWKRAHEFMPGDDRPTPNLGTSPVQPPDTEDDKITHLPGHNLKISPTTNRFCSLHMGHEEDHVFFCRSQNRGDYAAISPPNYAGSCCAGLWNEKRAKKAAVGFNARSETCDFGMKYWTKSQNGPEWWKKMFWLVRIQHKRNYIKMTQWDGDAQNQTQNIWHVMC